MNKRSANVGTSFSGLLFLLFLYLKLTNQIDWSWWWVSSPLWIPVCVLFAVLLLSILFLGTISLLIGISKYVQKQTQ